VTPLDEAADTADTISNTKALGVVEAQGLLS
jgi:hypothetical protein